MKIKLFTNLNKIKESYSEMLERENFSNEYIRDSVKDMHKLYALYEIITNGIYINLASIYEDYTINLIDKITESITHEVLHYVLHKEFNFKINIYFFSNDDLLPKNLHHTIINELGYYHKVDSDKKINNYKRIMELI